jgi:tryptophan halogenase
MFHTPLQHASVRGYVYSGEFLGEEAAHRRLSEVAGESARGRINNARLTRARPERFWVRNCLALPGGTLDPLEASGLHLAQTGITRFLAHLPASRADEGARREYDRLTRDEHDRVRDLLLLHYHASGRNDSPFWEHCRRQPLPGTLVRRLELFADSARVITGEEEFVGVDGWLAVLLGQRLEPRSYDPLAELTAPEVARRALAKLRDQMRTTAAMLPVHRDCIVRRGAAAPSLGRE